MKYTLQYLDNENALVPIIFATNANNHFCAQTWDNTWSRVKQFNERTWGVELHEPPDPTMTTDTGDVSLTTKSPSRQPGVKQTSAL